MGTTRTLLVLLSKGRLGPPSRGIMFFGNYKHDNEGSRHGTTCPHGTYPWRFAGWLSFVGYLQIQKKIRSGLYVQVFMYTARSDGGSIPEIRGLRWIWVWHFVLVKALKPKVKGLMPSQQGLQHHVRQGKGEWKARWIFQGKYFYTYFANVGGTLCLLCRPIVPYIVGIRSLMHMQK
jgi:hypothetical protein